MSSPWGISGMGILPFKPLTGLQDFSGLTKATLKKKELLF
jgi:hypothetical protein